MNSLARINGESLAVPGLRFWGGRDIHRTGWTDRVSLIASDSRGAVELWQAGYGYSGAQVGGIEVHSRTPQYDGQEPLGGSCAALHGDDCYADGSTLAYTDQALPLIQAGDSAGVLRLLARWHEAHFAARTEANP